LKNHTANNMLIAFAADGGLISAAMHFNCDNALYLRQCTLLATKPQGSQVDIDSNQRQQPFEPQPGVPSFATPGLLYTAVNEHLLLLG